MNPSQYLLLAAGVLMLFLAIRSAYLRHKERKQRDFLRKLETLLQPKESINVICPQKGSRCILTSRRLIFERRENFHAVPLKSIIRAQGINASGNRTNSIPKMVSLTVKAEQDYVIRNTCPEFAQLASGLTAAVRKQNERKKGK